MKKFLAIAFTLAVTAAPFLTTQAEAAATNVRTYKMLGHTYQCSGPVNHRECKKIAW